MGCCFSRPAGPNSPYPGGAQSGSARAINPPPANASSADEASAAAAAGRRRPHSSQPLSQHIDKRLRRHVWTSRNRSWSRSSITREREDFFDTRVTGRPEVWQALRAAIDVLLSSASDDDEALATAQSIIRAAEITLPTGDLANGAYDSLGNYYPVPEWVVADPDNLIDDGSSNVARKGGVINSEGSDDEEEEEEEDDDDLLEIERRREEKGKAVIDVRDQIIVKARLSENARDISISIDKKDTVRVLARKILIESGLPSKKKIRIAYMGKILKENVSLVDHGWKQGHVVNALVFNR